MLSSSKEKIIANLIPCKGPMESFIIIEIKCIIKNSNSGVVALTRSLMRRIKEDVPDSDCVSHLNGGWQLAELSHQKPKLRDGSQRHVISHLCARRCALTCCVQLGRVQRGGRIQTLHILMQEIGHSRFMHT